MNKNFFLVINALLATPSVVASETVTKSSAHLNSSTMLIKYSMLPSKVVVNAMTDEQYNDSLVNSPNEVLNEYLTSGIRVDFITHKNNGSMRHFCIPYVDSVTDKSTKDILNEVMNNMGNDYSLTYMLPPSILAKALKDNIFKKRLLENPNGVLKDHGFEVDKFTCVIHENTPEETHLFISEPSINKSSMNSLKDKFRAQALSGSTTKCCATGTCD